MLSALFSLLFFSRLFQVRFAEILRVLNSPGPCLDSASPTTAHFPRTIKLRSTETHKDPDSPRHSARGRFAVLVILVPTRKDSYGPGQIKEMTTPPRSPAPSTSAARLSRSASASPAPGQVQGALVTSLDNAHASLSDLAAAPLTATHQALDQTRSGLHSTARLLSDATQNLVRSQRNMQMLIDNIKNVQEFLPDP